MAEPSNTRRWLTYIGERSPLPLLLIIGAGQALSGLYLFRTQFSFSPVFHAALGIVGLLALMRLMDEVKDEAKDRVAHPERPLPRGLLTAAQVRRAILVVGAALIAYAALLIQHFSAVAGVLYVATVLYAFLMYREFFAPKLLGRSVWFYTATHQVIVIPMYLFVVAASSPDQAFSATAWWFALTGLSASFIVEVCRKLDPSANPILGTYLHVYGRGQVLAAVTGALILLAASTIRIGVSSIVWPFAAILALSLPIIIVAPRRFKVVEGASALLGLAQMLAPAIHHVLG